MNSTWSKFLKRVEKGANKNECWVWNGTKDRNGYGRMSMDGRRIGAHRLSWELHYGEIPGRLLVLHKCDNPPCVNPGHLFLGTQKDNMRDKASKGRCVNSLKNNSKNREWYASLNPATGEKHGTHTRPEARPRGERNGSAKLTEANVIAIREEYASGGTSERELAKKYGISKSNVGGIIKREYWAHI